jgi:hypothetical protein
VCRRNPDLPANNPFFKCPFCKRGKMVKKGGNKTIDKDSFIPRQAYHMDLAFVGGPSNLDLEKGSNITPSPIVKKGRDGYIGFLTIIDVSSRKLWTHLIKNKDLPIAYIDKFLKRHGIQTTNPLKAIIITSEAGYLAKSRAFEDTLREQQYVVQPTDDDIDFFGDLLPDHVEATITIYGGGELSKSHDLKRVCNSHGYEVNSTAADSSSQNGIVERPHRTLKERMRCMMYSARPGTEFWADALLHATWLYNRAYHSKIKMTPLQAFSGQIPALNRLITSGAKITAKKPGTRPTTLNPWAYDGIFLGYQNTMEKVRVNGLFQVELSFFDCVDRGAHVTCVTMPTAQYLATRKILKKFLRIESHHNDNGNVSNRTSMGIDLFNRIQAMVPLTAPLLGSFFYGGIFPSKIGPIAPS